MIDWGFMILVTSLVASMIDFERFEGASALAWAVPAPHTPANLLAWRGATVAFLVQALLIARSGQSLGKLLTGLRIVRRDGQNAGVFQGFVMREIPFRGVSFVAGSLMLPNLPVPLLAGLAGLCVIVNVLDDAWILGAERRCWHDRLAGTRVVSARRWAASNGLRHVRR